MNRRMTALLAGLLLLVSGTAFGSTINFSSVEGAAITFYGDTNTFEFLPEASGEDFQITNVIGAADPDTAGLFGNIEGTFQIGSIKTLLPGVQYAPVTDIGGSFSINDENGDVLLADLDWLNIATAGTVGALNFLGTANLTNITYGGSNADLLHLFNNGGGTTVSFQFSPPLSLTQLTRDGSVNSTSYSGTTVPEPGTIMLLGSGLFGLAGWGRKKFISC
jgi:hypothetical protein